MRPDTIWRIFSMTKPVTGVALLTLYEQGKVALKDPVERYLPEFRGAKVRERDADGDGPPRRPRAADDGARPADAHLRHRLRPAGAPAWTSRPSATAHRRPACPAAATCRCWSSAWAPSRCASTRAPTGCTRGRPTWPPGWSRWCPGQRFDEYLQATIFDPLGMVDTGFSVPDATIDRFAALYRRDRGQAAGAQRRPADERLPHAPRVPVGRRRPRVDRGRLPALLPDAGRRRRGRRRAGAGAPHGRADADEPPARRGRPARRSPCPAATARSGFDGMGFGLTVAVSSGPAGTQAAGSAGDVPVGRAGVDDLLDRPRRRRRRRVHDPAHAVGHVRLPGPAHGARLRRARRAEGGGRRRSTRRGRR